MMIDKRLIGIVPECKKFIAGNIIFQWCALLANIAMMTSITNLLALLYVGRATSKNIWMTLLVAVIAMIIRYISTTQASEMGYYSSKAVKKTLREKIYGKLLRLGASYNEQVNTSEVVQVCVEGVDQLETYFAQYLPQFFYAVLAPLTLFVYLCFVNVPSAIVLLVCVPLIPVAIAAVQTWAKKLLGKYWSQYTSLGDTFLENLQGLTTLKIYQADEFKNGEMNEESEKFRKITMKVLTMQLNSVTIMDFIAYGGAALGLIMAVSQLVRGNVTIAGAILIILLSADFFIPMRQLGSFFHIAMNGMAASEKIFKLLDMKEPEDGFEEFPENGDIECSGLTFSYEEDREVLHGLDMTFKEGTLTALVGESGCGKSTVAQILMGRNKGFGGSINVGDIRLNELKEAELMKNITYVGFQSYLFKGTLKENLLMGKPDASDEELWAALERTNLASFVQEEGGLEMPLAEGAGNLSGGQRQRLALARAILHDSPVYIFDEATSNIDVESENDIMKEINTLAKTKTVILISHRLANVAGADNIYVMESGNIVESGTHQELLKARGLYEALWTSQQKLENFSKKEGGAR